MKVPQLTQMAANYETKLARMIEQMADQIVEGAQRRVYQNLKGRRRHSPLAESIRRAHDPDGGIRVFTDKPYARYVEFGTIAQSARPFLTPATEEVKVTFANIKTPQID